jgi:hypothetical protein
MTDQSQRDHEREARALERLDRWLETCPDPQVDFVIRTFSRSGRGDHPEADRYQVTLYNAHGEVSDAWCPTLADCVDEILGKEK